MTHWSDKLKALGACREAIAWCGEQPSLATAWRVCDRGDWMLWLAGRLSGKPGSHKRRRLVLAACDCAELGKSNWHGPEPAEALRVARSWARGEGATLEDMRTAAAAADCAYAADCAAAADCAYAADCAAAADCAYAADCTATYAAYADANCAATYADCAYAAACAAAADCAADIVRKHYPRPPSLPREGGK